MTPDEPTWKGCLLIGLMLVGFWIGVYLLVKGVWW